MGKYIQKNGKMAGSLPDAPDVPTAAPAVPARASRSAQAPASSDIVASFDTFAKKRGKADLDAQVEQTLALIDDAIASVEANPAFHLRIMKDFLRKQAEIFAAKLETTKASNPGKESHLWNAVDEVVQSELERLGLLGSLRIHDLERGMASTRSIAGKIVFDLVQQYAHAKIIDNLVRAERGDAPEEPYLVGFKTDLEFQDAVTKARNLADVIRAERKERSNPALLTVADENRLIRDAVDKIANDFHIDRKYVHRLVTKTIKKGDEVKESVTYPDSVSVFSDGSIVIAEHKLSGANDSKSVSKNLEILDKSRDHMRPQGGGKVQTAVALPFDDVLQSNKSRWTRHHRKPDMVLSHGDVWGALTGEQITQGRFEAIAREVAPVIANVAIRNIVDDRFEFAADTTMRWEPVSSNAQGRLF